MKHKRVGSAETSQIPGASIVGYGFDILGKYNTSSITSLLFKKSSDGTQFTYRPTGITYSVPENLSVIEETGSSSEANVFQSRTKMQEHFALKTGVKGSYEGFKGEANIAYSSTVNSETSYYYGLYESELTGWRLSLQSSAYDRLSPEFTEDPDVKNLPKAYDDSTKDAFFQFFHRFGTHYIDQVVVGGSLLYCSAIEQSYSSDMAQIEGKVSLEYNAVMMSAGNKTESEWARLGEQWAQHRNVTLIATGGDPSKINAFAPQYGDSAAGLYDVWSATALQNPAVVNFVLHPIDELFSGTQAKAMQKALDAYLNTAIVVTADLIEIEGDLTSSSSIVIKGHAVKPDNPSKPPLPPPRFPVAGFRIALFEPETFQTIFSKLYYFDHSQPQQYYATIMADLDTVEEDEYLTAVSGFGLPTLTAFPSEDFEAWLLASGAKLAEWRAAAEDDLGRTGVVNYLVIGAPGLPPEDAQTQFALDVPSPDETIHDFTLSYSNQLVQGLYADVDAAVAERLADGFVNFNAGAGVAYTLRWTNRGTSTQDWTVQNYDDFTLQPNHVRAANINVNNNHTFNISVSTDNTFAYASLTYTAATNQWTLNTHTPNEWELETGNGIVTVRCLLNVAVATHPHHLVEYRVRDTVSAMQA